jgi:hypothetical protein
VADERFDRIKPVDRRLLERRSGERLDTAEADADGRAALFSSGVERDRERARARERGGDPAGGEGAAAPLAAHCSRCDATTPVDAATAVRAVLPLAVVVPWRDHPVFAVCPACRQRAWLKVTAS